MKKLIILTLLIFGISNGWAQYNPLQFFPNTEGSELLSNTYDAHGNLVGKMKYTILESYDYHYPAYAQTNIAYEMMDNQGNIMDTGTLTASFEGEHFQLTMKNGFFLPDYTKYLSMATEIAGDFLDYPDVFGSDVNWQNNPVFEFEGGELIMRSPENRRDLVSIRVYDRQLVDTEKIQTPAGIFDAAKVTFKVDFYESDTDTHTYYDGTEWYSAGAGVVRTEIREKGSMMNYTELAFLDVK